MLGQSTIHFLTQFNIDKVIQSLAESTVMMGVPTFYTRLLDTAEFTSQTCEKMRLFISGSAPLLSETHKQFEEKTGHKILERYGMTECGMITSNPFTGERIAGTVGFSLPDISVRVADEQGNTLKNNEIGVLEVKGPNVFSGYWQMPKKTKQEFREDGYFITGDLSTMDEQGRVSIVGRAKDLIISGGFNIYPKEIESKIDEILGVKESAVIGVTHSDFGEAAVAVVVQEQQAKLTNADIQVQLRQDLANFKQPKKIIFVDELPRNTMGKVQKVQLRKAYQAAFSS
jgi:malonyl-CoA/methylmalonyl-CoA synthetase